MPDVIPIQFTQDQARMLTGVSAETVRHWRKTIPYLSSKTGKSARFSFADLLGLAITNEMVNSFGVHIGTVSAGVDALFRLLASSRPALLDGSVALVTATDAILRDVGLDGGPGQMPVEAAFAISVTPLITRIQQHMLPVMPVSSQAALPFPPEAVRRRA